MLWSHFTFCMFDMVSRALVMCFYTCFGYEWYECNVKFDIWAFVSYSSLKCSEMVHTPLICSEMFHLSLICSETFRTPLICSKMFHLLLLCLGCWYAPEHFLRYWYAPNTLCSISMNELCLIEIIFVILHWMRLCLWILIFCLALWKLICLKIFLFYHGYVSHLLSFICSPCCCINFSG